MNIAISTAEEAKLLVTANKKFKEAKQLADWILLNGELRDAAKRFKLQAQNNRSAANEYEPTTYNTKQNVVENSQSKQTEKTAQKDAEIER